VTNTPKPKPVGQRPRCLQCNRELKPNYHTERPPLQVHTGNTIKIRTSRSYGTSIPEYEDAPESRPTTEAERKQWRKDHPPVWRGTYGGYKDNRFCGLNCGYDWAVRHTQPQK